MGLQGSRLCVVSLYAGLEHSTQPPTESSVPMGTAVSTGQGETAVRYSTYRPTGAYGTTDEAFVVSVTARLCWAGGGGMQRLFDPPRGMVWKGGSLERGLTTGQSED